MNRHLTHSIAMAAVIINLCYQRGKAAVLPDVMPHSFDSGTGYLAEWGIMPDGQFAMRLSAETTGWVAIGFSQNRSMIQSDMVVGAVAPNGSFSFVGDRFATSRTEPRVDTQQDIEVLSAEHFDGVTSFEFTRPFATTDSRNDFDLSSGSHFLLYAWGGSARANGRIGQHPSDKRIVSSQSFDLFASDQIVFEEPQPLLAGDADQDFDFDQVDLVKVQIAAKYLTGNAATWGEGDWNGAPGGEQGNPPSGDNQFNQLDVVAALGANIYLTGPYAALVQVSGVVGDSQTSLVYDAASGELSVDAPANIELTSINVNSAGMLFKGDKPGVLDGAFDNFAQDNLFKATFGGSFGSISFGPVLDAGIGREQLVQDLTAVGSLAGGGDLGAVDLVYIPEPSCLMLAAIGAVFGFLRRRRTLHLD